MGNRLRLFYKTRVGRNDFCRENIQRERKLLDGYQFVYVSQSKYESIPLCAVDASSPSLQASSLL
jgi:hypothetical protein